MDITSPRRPAVASKYFGCAEFRATWRPVTEMPEPAVVDQDLWNDLQPLLDQELSRLPDIYRVVLVLSDLEGKTRKETARHLGLLEGTVGSRLARARVLLAAQLGFLWVILRRRCSFHPCFLGP
jgi:DNA-directed RNA polymerase specialized sigma24 family protein